MTIYTTINDTDLFIAGAFSWENTQSGYLYWQDIDYKWSKICKKIKIICKLQKCI